MDRTRINGLFYDAAELAAVTLFIGMILAWAGSAGIS
jgi:hypothetical protein